MIELEQENCVYKLIEKQLCNYFELTDSERIILKKYVPIVLGKIDRCLEPKNSDNVIFLRTWNHHFNPFHSTQYMIFLYWMSHLIYQDCNVSCLCDKIYYLNKIMNSVDLFYAIELPAQFFAEHPLGSIMGRAHYGPGFFFYQGCTVGGNVDKDGNIHYPRLGENCCYVFQFINYWELQYWK